MNFVKEHETWVDDFTAVMYDLNLIHGGDPKFSTEYMTLLRFFRKVLSKQKEEVMEGEHLKQQVLLRMQRLRTQRGRQDRK